jgi:hypothetical protein
MDKAKIKNTLLKLRTTMSQTEKFQLSHWSWRGVVKSSNGSIAIIENDLETQFLALCDAPPIIWEGEAGTHPLLPLIDEALIEIDK